MANKANSERAKMVGRPDNEDKRKRLERCESLSQCFPGLKWYNSRKPSEVKPLMDHTTGLCRYCEQAGLNYQTLSKTLRRLCGCGTPQCPNWTCLCLRDEFDEDVEQPLCSCKCSCDDCRSCQVFTSSVLLMMMMMMRKFWLKVSALPDTVNSAVKSLLCPKLKLPHMQREIYNPSCLSYCSDLCGTRYSTQFLICHSDIVQGASVHAIWTTRPVLEEGCHTTCFTAPLLLLLSTIPRSAMCHLRQEM